MVNNGGWVGALLVSVLVSSASCASQVRRSGGLASPVEGEVAVAVMSLKAGSGPAAEALSRELVGCVVHSLRAKLPDLRIVPAEDFARAALAEVPLKAAPVGPESLAVLLKDEVFLAGVERSGVRFLITVEGGTTQSSPDMQAYLAVWRRESTVTARVYDLRARSEVGEVQIKVSGRPWFLLFPPLAVPSFTESWACGKLGGSVADLLGGRRG